jgi:hypothetical protein
MIGTALRRRFLLALGPVVLLGTFLPFRVAAADRPPSLNASAKSFISLAKRGISGSFSAIYRLSAQLNAGTVVVAQEAPSGHIAFLTGPGSWSFVLENQAGYSSQWIERGSQTWDCWRPPGETQWTCSGPGQFRDVNGYLMAISPYVPGQVLDNVNQLEGALTSTLPPYKAAIKNLAFYSSYNVHFGPLRCIHVANIRACFDRSGVLVKEEQSGTGVTLLHYSSKVPNSAFRLMGSTASSPTFVALHQPYVN